MRPLAFAPFAALAASIMSHGAHAFVVILPRSTKPKMDTSLAFGIYADIAVPGPASDSHVIQATEKSKHSSETSEYISSGRSSSLLDGIHNFLVPPANAAETAPKPPTNDEVKLLREALGAFYGERNYEKAEGLLTQAISAWERQNPDERAALYRVRGDTYLDLRRPADAVRDYTKTIDLLNSPGGELADPAELPAAYLGRARSMRATALAGISLTTDQWKSVATDYQLGLKLSSTDDYLETDAEKEGDGAMKNPYAAWEWGMAQRAAGDYSGASETHTLASLAFKDIGDKARSVISALDAGVDLAASESYFKEAKELLEKAIPKTTAVAGTDVELLQRVIAKEGEARIALASILWNASDKAGAEAQLGEACVRLDQLEADNADREAARIKKGLAPPPKINKVSFSIDDIAGAGKISCSRFKNEDFLTKTVEWPSSLQKKVQKLNKLG